MRAGVSASDRRNEVYQYSVASLTTARGRTELAHGGTMTARYRRERTNASDKAGNVASYVWDQETLSPRLDPGDSRGWVNRHAA